MLELYSVRGAMLFFRKLVSVGTMNKINYMYLKKSYVIKYCQIRQQHNLQLSASSNTGEPVLNETVSGQIRLRSYNI